MKNKTDKELLEIEQAFTEKPPVELVTFDPSKDITRAKDAADMLKDIVKKNGWARKLGGQSEHLQYEAWQTIGKFYNCSVETYDAEYVTLGTVTGFKAKAVVIDTLTGRKIGGAEAYCMKDEGNWKSKPTFQLASMAQTRAGSKSLRQIFGFVVALAGYSPTPAEEMDGESPRDFAQRVHSTSFSPVREADDSEVRQIYTDVVEAEDVPIVEAAVKKHEKIYLPINGEQKLTIISLMGKKGKTMKDIDSAIQKTAKFIKQDGTHAQDYKDLSHDQAASLIAGLSKQPDVVTEEVDPDEAEQGIEQMRLAR